MDDKTFFGMFVGIMIGAFIASIIVVMFKPDPPEILEVSCEPVVGEEEAAILDRDMTINLNTRYIFVCKEAA